MTNETNRRQELFIQLTGVVVRWEQFEEADVEETIANEASANEAIDLMVFYYLANEYTVEDLKDIEDDDLNEGVNRLYTQYDMLKFLIENDQIQ